MSLILQSLLLGATVPLAVGATTGNEEDIALKTKVYRNWKFRLPAESWKKVGKAIHVPSWGKDARFETQLDGTSLQVDTDGDGELDTKVSVTGGVVLLVKDGNRMAVRLRSKPTWSFAPASVQTGKIDGTKVSFIDQNNNGRFDDYGADAMVVGIGKTAGFLSKVAQIKGKLFNLSVSADGRKVTYSPYEGDTSTVDFKILTKGKVLGALLTSTNGELCFDVARTQKVTLPTATYKLHGGLLSFGGNQVSMRTGRAKAFELTAGKTTEIRLGGPLNVEFGMQAKNGQYHFNPNAIWYFGRAGEEYFNWQPLGKSPKIKILDRNSKEVIAEAVFPPNC